MMAARPTATASPEWLGTAVLVAPIVAITFLSKLAIPPFGAHGIGITLPIIATVVLVGAAAGVLRISPQRFAVFLSVTGFLGALSLFGEGDFSTNSLLMFAVVHLPFAFEMQGGRADFDKAVKFYLNVALLLACGGIAQYFLQHFVAVKYVFPIENFLPPSLLIQNFNNQGLMGYGSHVYRANGIFMLEPSFFAQYLAIAAVAELCTFNRLRRVPVYVLALLVANSGTGLAILALCLPPIVINRKRWDLILAGLLILLVAFTFKDVLSLDRLMSRANEFSDGHTSGFERFVGGFYLFDQVLWNDPWRTLFGTGAGTFTQFGSQSAYAAAEMPVFKMILEYGLVGATLYFCCLAYFLLSSPQPKVLIAAIALTFVFNGIYTAFGPALALGLLIWPSKDRYTLSAGFARSPTIFRSIQIEGAQ